MDYSKSKTNIQGEFGEKLFHRHGEEIMKRFVYLKPKIPEWGQLEKHPEFWRFTDVDTITQETDEKHAKKLIRHGIAPSNFDEIKTEYRCFKKGKATGNICLETISDSEKYKTGTAEKGELFGGVPCTKRNGIGWMFAKTGVTADWWHFVLVIGEGMDETLSPAALEAWRRDDKVPEDAKIIMKAKPEAIIVSIIEKKLEELARQAETKSYLKKEFILMKVENVMHEMTCLEKPHDLGEVSNYTPPRSCIRYGKKADYYAPFISDDDKEKYFKAEKSEHDKRLRIPIMMTTGIFKAQKKNGEEIELALSGRPNENKNVYIAPEIRKAIENFYGMKEEYPLTCEVCKCMIRWTRKIG